MASEAERITRLRDRLRDRILARLSDVMLNGHPTGRLPNNLNLSFLGVEGESLIMGMPELAVASGSACSAGSQEPSYVIRALGGSPDRAHASVRFGLGRSTTEEEIDFAVETVVKAVTRLRELSPHAGEMQRAGAPRS
jgi:cysteine desulfurase